MKHFCRAGLVVAVLHASMHGQQAGPTISGFIHTSDRTLRPILGVPGSAWLGAPIADSLDQAWTAPNGRWAIAVAGGKSVVLRDLELLRATVETDARLLPAVDRVVWNSDGSAACLLSSASGRIQRIQIRAGAISVDPSAELPYVGDAVTALAINAAGRISLAIAGRGVFTSRSDAALELVVPLEKVSALAYYKDDVLVIADATNGRIVSADIAQVPSSHHTLAESVPDVVAVIACCGKIHAVTRGSVRTFDFDGSLQSEVVLDKRPDDVHTLSGGATLLLNAPANGMPALVIDLRQNAGVFFVPVQDVSQL
jgi:hypothetical protein